MRRPSTASDWIVVSLILLVGTAALIGLLPWSARHPFLVPPDLYDRLPGFRRPFMAIMNLIPVLTGIAVVTVCAALYFWWMCRPLVIRPASSQKGQE
jgi:hypothetical protein